MAAFNLDGKTVAVNDRVTIIGQYVSSTGKGPTASITVAPLTTNVNFVAQANDMQSIETTGADTSIGGNYFGNTGDAVSVLGFVTAISGSGNTAILTVTLVSSGLSIQVPAGSCHSVAFV